MIINGTQGVLVEDNVIYDVLGNGLFVENAPGQETIIQRNLFVNVKNSSGLGTAPSTAIWMGEANNTVIDNVVAGGNNFGFW